MVWAFALDFVVHEWTKAYTSLNFIWLQMAGYITFVSRGRVFPCFSSDMQLGTRLSHGMQFVLVV